MQAVEKDLEKLSTRAFHRADAAKPVLIRYHSTVIGHEIPDIDRLNRLYRWLFVPLVLWPFNIQDVLAAWLDLLKSGKRLGKQPRLLADLLPEPPAENVCATVAEHEVNLQKGVYENLVTAAAKYAQFELAVRTDVGLRDQWAQIKAAFDVDSHRDHKGVIRRTMSVERNLRPSFSVNMARRDDVFRAAFDAFCLRWNLYGMQNDEPLLLKLAVNITPYGTMIHIPAYWSFDTKRDIRWDAVARLHRVRVPKRQGAALTAGFAERMKAAEKLRDLDQTALRLGLKGDRKHVFICAGLDWDPRTSPRRISRLREESKQSPGAKEAK